jgi:hypothetical protein
METTDSKLDGGSNEKIGSIVFLVYVESNFSCPEGTVQTLMGLEESKSA